MPLCKTIVGKMNAWLRTRTEVKEKTAMMTLHMFVVMVEAIDTLFKFSFVALQEKFDSFIPTNGGDRMRHHIWAVRDQEQGKWITFT